MNYFKKRYPRHDPVTGEYFWNGKWYDSYPKDEVDEYNMKHDMWMESKFEEKREE